MEPIAYLNQTSVYCPRCALTGVVALSLLQEAYRSVGAWDQVPRCEACGALIPNVPLSPAGKTWVQTRMEELQEILTKIDRGIMVIEPVWSPKTTIRVRVSRDRFADELTQLEGIATGAIEGES